MDFNSNTVVTVLVVISNFAYLFPAILSWYVRFYELFSYLVTVFVVSSLHHLCTDGEICFGIDPVILSGLDTSFAFIAIGVTLISVAIYELLFMNRMQQLINEGYTVRTYPISRAYSDKMSYVLVKHTYADIFIAFLIIIVIISVFVLGDSAMALNLILAIYVAIVWTFHWLLYWRLKIRNRDQRYYWPAILIAIVFAVTSVLIFGVLEHKKGRVLHALWHVTGALTCAAWLIGTTAYHIWSARDDD